MDLGEFFLPSQRPIVEMANMSQKESTHIQEHELSYHGVDIIYKTWHNE